VRQSLGENAPPGQLKCSVPSFNVEFILMDPSKASALSRDVTTSLATLEELAQSDLPFLRENVARHPNVTAELLLSLVPSSLESDGDLSVAKAVVSNPRTPSTALLAVIRLLQSERLDGSRRENWRWEDVAVVALSHGNIPGDDAVNAIESLELPRSLKIRLANQHPNKRVLEFLLLDQSEAVRMVAASVLDGVTEHVVGPERR
jgi:hypothetical protein